MAVIILAENAVAAVLKTKASKAIVNLKKNLTALLKRNASLESKNEDRILSAVVFSDEFYGLSLDKPFFMEGYKSLPLRSRV